MRSSKVAALAVSSALSIFSAVGWSGGAACAASVTSTVTMGRLNQGLSLGSAYAFQLAGVGSPPSFGSQIPTGGQGAGSATSGTLPATAGTVPVPAPSGGITTGRLNAGSPPLTFVLAPLVNLPPLQGSGPAPQSGGEQASSTGSAIGTAPAPGQSDPSYVLALANEQRARVGAQALALDPALMTLAQERAQALADNHVITHDVPGYGYADAMEMAAGIKGRLLGAEDIATGPTVYQAFWMLMTSDWHRANLLFPGYNAAGIGIAPMSDGNLVLDILFIQS